MGAVKDVVAATRALTPEGRGADVVIEAVASPIDVGVGGRYGAEGGAGQLLWWAAERDEGEARYEPAALWGHYVEGEFSPYAGDLQNGL